MNLHPYDGIERRFRDTDADQTKGLAALMQVLQLSRQPPSEAVRYDLSFYSGGIGVFDTLAVAFPFDLTLWRELVAHHDARRPEDLAAAMSGSRSGGS